MLCEVAFLEPHVGLARRMSYIYSNTVFPVDCVCCKQGKSSYSLVQVR